MLGLALGCIGPRGVGRAPDVDSPRAALLRTSRDAESRARTGNFVDALSALFDSGGVYVTSTTTLAKGPAGARAWLARDTLNAQSSAMWNVLRADVSADGRDGFTYGYFDVVRAAGDTAYGKYHAYWRRGQDGAWRILAFSRGRRAPGPWQVASDEYQPRVRTVTGPGDTIATLQVVFATEAEFADSVGVDVGRAFGAFAEPDAGKLDAGRPSYVFGREAIRGLFVGAPPGGPLWRPEAGSVSASNDLAFTYGPAWPRTDGNSPGTQPRGRYFTIWRRQPDGTWRYVVD